MFKFNKGDRVVVVKNLLGGPDTSIGQRGEVLHIQDTVLGVEVKTKDYGSLMFMPGELEFEETYDIMSAPHPDEVPVTEGKNGWFFSGASEPSSEEDSLFSQEVDTRHDDVVNHPSHYTRGKYEVIDIIEDSGVGYRLGNVLKYVLRCDHKHDDNGVEDLKKALWYLKREIDAREGL